MHATHKQSFLTPPLFRLFVTVYGFVVFSTALWRTHMVIKSFQIFSVSQKLKVHSRHWKSKLISRMITIFAVLVLFLYLGKTPKSWWLSAQWKSELRRSYENTEESIDKNCGGIYVTVIRKRGASSQSVTTADQHFLAYSAEGVFEGQNDWKQNNFAGQELPWYLRKAREGKKCWGVHKYFPLAKCGSFSVFVAAITKVFLVRLQCVIRIPSLNTAKLVSTAFDFPILLQGL